MENLKSIITGQLKILAMIRESGFPIIDIEIAEKALLNNCHAILHTAKSLGIDSDDLLNQLERE